MADDRVFSSVDNSGNEVELKFVKPSQKILSKGDFIYREYFGKSVRAGLLTNAEANKLLKDRNVWGDDREDELLDIQREITKLETEIQEVGKSPNGFDVYKELKRLRGELRELNSIRRTIIENTAESVASEMRTQFYAAECVVYNTSGRKVFVGLDDFTEKLSDRLTLDCYRQALISNYESIFGIDLSGSQDVQLVEDKWFEEFKPENAKTNEVKDEASEEKPKPKPKKKRRARKKKKVSSTED